MAISIQNASLNQTLLNQVASSQNKINANLEKLSTGIKINRAGDNAALLEAANNLEQEVRGISQATRNVNDGIATVQIADEGLASIQHDQTRLQELALQASNGTLNDTDRKALNDEAQALQDNIDQTITSTNYNGIQVIGSNSTLALQSGPNQGDQFGVQLEDQSTRLNRIDLSTQGDAQAALGTLETNQANLSESRARIGATQNGLEQTANRLSQASVTSAEARSNAVDADYAALTAGNVKNTIQQLGALAVLAQSNNNQVSEEVLSML